MEKLSVLHDNANVLPEGFEIQIFDIPSVVGDGAFLGSFEAQKQTEKRGLSATGCSYNGHILAGGDLKG